jgi:hypothetical protein
MSDYLSNLAAKSLDAVATIRPRLASFYEAPQRGFALPPEPAAETGEVTTDVVSMPAQPREGPAAPPSKRPAVTDDPPDAAVDGDHIQPRAARITATVVNDERSETPTPAPGTPRRTVDHIPEPAAVTSLPEPPIADAAVC